MTRYRVTFKTATDAVGEFHQEYVVAATNPADHYDILVTATSQALTGIKRRMGFAHLGVTLLEKWDEERDCWLRWRLPVPPKSRCVSLRPEKLPDTTAVHSWPN